MYLSCTTGIGLILNDVQYTNNSVVTITDIGTDSAALICTTTYYPAVILDHYQEIIGTFLIEVRLKIQILYHTTEVGVMLVQIILEGLEQ